MVIKDQQIILNEVKGLRSEAHTNPLLAVNNLLNLGENDNSMDVDGALMDSGIHGRIDYMLMLKHKCIDDLNEHYYYYDCLDAKSLDQLDSMTVDYVYVNEDGLTVESVSSDNVIEAIDDTINSIKINN